MSYSINKLKSHILFANMLQKMVDPGHVKVIKVIKILKLVKVLK